MLRKLSCAVIGVGNMGKHHARLYSQMAKLIAVADPVEKIAKQIAKKYNCAYYRNYKTMIGNEKIDALSIVVPTKYHETVADYSLRNKIPTLLEKPISDNLDSAIRIVEQAKESKTLLMVGHLERFNPAVIKLKQLIERKKFGRIIGLNSIRVGINPPPTKGSDVSLDLGIHDIDVFSYLLEETPIEAKVVRGKIHDKNIADHASILLRYRFASGIIQTNWMTPIKIRKLYITGTYGFAELDYISQKLILYEHPSQKKIQTNFKSLQTLVKNPKKQIFISKKEPLMEELNHFLNLVRLKKTEYPYFAVDALKVALS